VLYLSIIQEYNIDFMTVEKVEDDEVRSSRCFFNGMARSEYLNVHLRKFPKEPFLD
jgi:hypothetical protein